MKKWLFRIGSVSVVVFAGFIILILINEFDRADVKNFTKNENLKTIKSDFSGTPLDQKDRFVNLEHPFLPSTIDLLKWKLGENEFAEEKKSDAERLSVLDPTDFLNGEKDGILWLGHASFFVRVGGKSILLDPIFGDPPLVSTYVDVPSPLEKIKRVDYVLISHDHRDHADADSIKQIAEKFPNAVFLGGLRMDEIFNDWKTATNKTQNAGWFQQFDLPEDDLKIYFLPVRHWSRRGLFDTNWRLWGGYVIQSKGITIYFSGDSGYGNHYRQTAELFPEIDYFLIGIGAYEPRWFMEANHNNPQDALKAFQDAKANYLIPMHYGRFDLSDEPPGQPLKLLNEKAREMNLSDKIKSLNINESIEFKVF